MQVCVSVCMCVRVCARAMLCLSMYVCVDVFCLHCIVLYTDGHVVTYCHAQLVVPLTCSYRIRTVVVHACTDGSPSLEWDGWFAAISCFRLYHVLQCVIVTDASLSLQVRIDEFCRTHNPPIAVRATLFCVLGCGHCVARSLCLVHLLWSQRYFLICFLRFWT